MTTTRSAVLIGLVAGAAATVVKSKAEGVMQPAAEKLFPPAPVEKTLLGADPADHPENMPPAKIVENVQEAVSDDPSEKVHDTFSEAMHWVMGVGFAVGYAVAARRFPAVRAGRGTVAAAALFAGTHGSLLPLLGVQASPAKLPKAWWGWEGGSHLVYGAALDAGVSALEGLAARRRS